MTDLATLSGRNHPLAPTGAGALRALEVDGFDAPQEESLVRHYLRLLYRHRWLIGVVTALCVGIAVVASMLVQRQYTATTRIQIAREAAKVVELGKGEDETQQGTGLEFYQTQYALLRSRSLSEAVVRDLALDKNDRFLSEFKPRRENALSDNPDMRFEQAVKMVNANTKVAPVPGSSIVDVGYVSPDPALSARISNSIAQNFIQTSLARRYEATSYAREFLQSRINATRAKLEASERKAAQYAQAQGIIKISGQGEGSVSSEQTLASSDLAQLSSQLATARAQRVQAAADYQANSGGAAAVSALSNTTVNQLRGQRAQLSGELSKLESDFGPQYPRVVALRSQVAELDSAISQEQSRVTSGVTSALRDKYRQALANEQGLQARVNALKSDVLNQDQRSIQFNIIQRDVDTNRSLYDALLQRFKEVGVTAGVGTNNVSIVDKALAPEHPSTPNVPLNLALGLLGGLALGGAGALVREQMTDAVILPSEFQQKLGVKLLGTTPKLTDSEVLSQLAERESELSEAYFSILTAIQFSSSHQAPASMLFTSSRAGEGKSTTALTIARNLAGVGGRVLLIDADMRNPSLHRNLGLPNSTGLTEVLSGRAKVEETIHAVGSSSLSVMFAGRRSQNAAQLLSTSTIDEVLELVGETYDHVIMDGPPVLGLADAVLLSRAAEATVFVIEANGTRASQARLAIGRLRSVGADILGAVLTKLDAREAGYGDAYAYQYAYGSKPTSKPKLLSLNKYLRGRS